MYFPKVLPLKLSFKGALQLLRNVKLIFWVAVTVENSV